MNVFFIVLSIIATAMCAFLFIRYLVTKLPKSTGKVLLAILTVAGTLISSTLLIMATVLPSKIDAFLSTGIASVEEHINSISPGYIYEERDTQSLKTVLANYNQVKAGFDSNSGTQFIVRTIGVNSYIDLLDAFVSNIDENQKEMEQEQIPMTLHNVFMRVQDKSRVPIRKIVYNIEIAILVVTLVFFLILLISYFIVKNNDLSDAEVIMGEDLDKQEQSATS